MTQLSHPRYAVEIMEQLYSAAQAADEIKASKRTVTRLCQAHGIGVMVGNSLALTAEDIEALKEKFRGKPGNPTGFAQANAAMTSESRRAKGQHRKKSKKS